jgi:hypothetical protein
MCARELSGLTCTRVSEVLEEFPTRERMGKSIINLNSCRGHVIVLMMLFSETLVGVVR